MTGGNARRGRRDNGHYAADYAVVGDVDPRVGEHLLDVLGNRGIAAYLQPTSDQNPITRMTTLPARPTDRLFVDRAEITTAREFLEIIVRDGDGATLATPATGDGSSGTDPASDDPDGDSPTTTTLVPGGATATPASSDFEEAWASIVAEFDSGSGNGPTPWPAIEDLSAHDGTAPAGGGGPATPAGPREWPRWTPPDPNSGSLLDGLDTFGAGIDDDDEGDYHPPPPPPIPRPGIATVMGVTGIIAGIVLIVYPGLVPDLTSTTAAVIGCLFMVGGVAALIGRLRSGTDDDPDDPDDGAVV